MTRCSLCCNHCACSPIISSEDGLELLDKVKRQCSVIFLVRNLLRIPLPQCEELLRVYGDPEGWINLCSPCTSILNQALDFNDQINQLRKKIDELGNKLALPLKIKPEKNEDEEEGRVSSVKEPSAEKEIRKFIFGRNEENVLEHPKKIRKVQNVTVDCDPAFSFNTFDTWEGNSESDFETKYSKDGKLPSKRKKVLSAPPRKRKKRKPGPTSFERREREIEAMEGQELRCIAVGSFVVAYRELEGPDVKACPQPGCCFKAVSISSIRKHLKNFHNEKDDDQDEFTLTPTPLKIADKIIKLPNDVDIKHSDKEPRIIDVPLFLCKICMKKMYFRIHAISHLRHIHKVDIPVSKAKSGSQDEYFFQHVENTVETGVVVKDLSNSISQEKTIIPCCPFCEFSTKHAFPLAVHIQKNHHLYSHVFKKDWAEETTFSGLLKHTLSKMKSKDRSCKARPLSKRLNIKTFDCDEHGCEAKFTTYPEWNEHKKKEHAEHGYPCFVCGIVIRHHLTGLENHVRAKHREDKETPLPCPGCNEVCSKYAFVQEFQQHLKKANCKPECIEKSVPCPSCDWRLENQTTLDIHMRVKHLTQYKVPYPCPICAKGFNNRTHAYYEHVRSHTEDISQICERCGKKVKSKNALRKHIIGVHMDKFDNGTNYKCPQCPTVLKTLPSLRRHIESLHSEENPYMCEICAKGFKRKDKLTLHMKDHHDSGQLNWA